MAAFHIRARPASVLGVVARYTLAGAVVGAAAGGALFWFVQGEVVGVLQDEASRRAVDQVQLGVLPSATAVDLEAPHTLAKRNDLGARLHPLLSRLAARDSGIIGFNIIAADGTVVYSDTPSAEGLVIPPAEQQLLARTLGGSVRVGRSELEGPEHAERRARYEAAFEVYVPIVLDGAVVGAYEIYEDASALDRIAQLWAAGVVVLTCLLFHLLGHLAARRAQLRPQPAGAGMPIGARLRRRQAPGVASVAMQLTPRELQVLALLATSESYHDIAEVLVVSPETVRTHVKRILRKLGAPNQTQAVLIALRVGILKPGLLDGPASITPQGDALHPGGGRPGAPRRLFSMWEAHRRALRHPAPPGGLGRQ